MTAHDPPTLLPTKSSTERPAVFASMVIGVAATALVHAGETADIWVAKLVATPFALFSFIFNPHQGSDIAYFGSMLVVFSVAGYLAVRLARRTGPAD